MNQNSVNDEEQPSHGHDYNGRPRGETVFHADFPDCWIVTSQEPVRTYAQVPMLLDAANQVYENDHPNNTILLTQETSVLLPNQVVQGTVWWGTNWIRTHKHGTFVSGEHVEPFRPKYRVVADTHADAQGVAPYMVAPPKTRDMVQYDAQSRTKTQKVPQELPPFYEADSPLRRADLAQPVGHMFERPPLDIREGDESNWWTMDGTVWWPKQVRTVVPFIGLTVPTWVPLLSSRDVTQVATPMEPTFLQQALDGRGIQHITLLVLVEYLLVIIGAVAGVRLGWSISLQLVYVACLGCLVCCEIAFVRGQVPNGALWMKMNKGGFAAAVWRGIMWRFDMYGDVGFSLLVFQQRDELFYESFWIAPMTLTVLVIGIRLVSCFYYLFQSSMDERTLSNLAIPSFLTMLQAVSRNLEFGDDTLALSSAKTETWFEAARMSLQDIPEIVLQLIYLFGREAPPSCSECAWGFVLVSLFTSVVTAFPGCSRLYGAVQRYRKCRGSCQEQNDKRPSPERDTTLRVDEHHHNATF